MSTPADTPPEATTPVKVLIVDDDPLFHKLIVPNIAKWGGYICQATADTDEAMRLIKAAEAENAPFSVVTIDMNFVVSNIEMPIGKTLIQDIKAEYPYIACIMVSGSGLSAHEVLDLRDDYGIDYYISKDRFDPDTFERGVKRALNRVRPLRNTAERRKLLEATLERYKDTYAIYLHNLSIVETQKAQQGLEVSVNLENQIKLYTEKVAQIQAQIQAITAEINALA